MYLFTIFVKMTMFSYCEDLPVMSVFKEQNEHNSSQREEEPTELTMADQEDEEIIEKEKKERSYKAYLNPQITWIIMLNISGPELT